MVKGVIPLQGHARGPVELRARVFGWTEEHHNRGSIFVGETRWLPRRQCVSRGRGDDAVLAVKPRAVQRRRSLA